MRGGEGGTGLGSVVGKQQGLHAVRTSERQTERDDDVSEDANVGRRFSAMLTLPEEQKLQRIEPLNERSGDGRGT